jgi:transcription elongation factor GreB
MSRGFVREGDQEEVPMVPPRAELPSGVTNYVTPAGLEQLLAEKQALVAERDNLDSSNESERRIQQNFLNAKLRLLNDRITEAKVINLSEQPPDEVRFGALVTLKIAATGKVQAFRIVGVDEADISKGKISFISPLARALVNKKAGEKAVLSAGREERIFEVLKISY